MSSSISNQARAGQAAPPARPARAPKAPPALPKQRQEQSEQPGGGWSLLHLASEFWHSSAGWLTSALVHLIILLMLGLLTLTLNEDEVSRALSAYIDGQEIEDLEDTVLEDLEEIEFDQLEALPVNITDPGVAALGETVGLDAEAVEVGTVNLSKTMGEIGTLFGKDGHGFATSGDGTGGAAFYGVRARGRKFIFVVDNSLSMNKGRFEAACAELCKSIDNLGSDQSFYVYFFSDTAYGLFHPNTAKGMVRATSDNKTKLYYWLPRVELVLRTAAHEAVESALKMNPDAIFILTDGAFTDDTFRYLMQREKGRTVINTVGMEINPRHEQILRGIANKHGGTYRLVRVDPRIRMLAAKQARKRNNTPGPVWGIALGQKRQRPAGRQGGNRPQQGAGKNKGGGRQGGKKDKKKP